MGIDYHCRSKRNPNIFEDSMDAYLSYALRHIEWETILNLLRIRLDSVYDTRINYWTPEQVNHMYESIKSLYENPHEILYTPYSTEEEINIEKTLGDDIKILLDHFKYLVDSEAYIYVV